MGGGEDGADSMTLWNRAKVMGRVLNAWMDIVYPGITTAS